MAKWKEFEKAEHNVNNVPDSNSSVNTQNTTVVFSKSVEQHLVTTLQFAIITMFLLCILLIGKMLMVAGSGLLVLLAMF